MTESRQEEWLTIGEAARRVGGIDKRTMRSILEAEGVEVLHLSPKHIRVRVEDVERIRAARLRPLVDGSSTATGSASLEA